VFRARHLAGLSDPPPHDALAADEVFHGTGRGRTLFALTRPPSRGENAGLPAATGQPSGRESTRQTAPTGQDGHPRVSPGILTCRRRAIAWPRAIGKWSTGPARLLLPGTYGVSVCALWGWQWGPYGPTPLHRACRRRTCRWPAGGSCPSRTTWASSATRAPGSQAYFEPGL
jgi:hypothetical protein